MQWLLPVNPMCIETYVYSVAAVWPVCVSGICQSLTSRSVLVSISLVIRNRACIGEYATQSILCTLRGMLSFLDNLIVFSMACSKFGMLSYRNVWRFPLT